MHSIHNQRHWRLITLIVALAFAVAGGCRSTQPSPEPTVATAARYAATQPSSLTICSFNIQFLGNSTKRDNAALAELVKGYDIVVVQELVAPPYPGTFPNGNPFEPDPQAAQFFDQMKARGFSYVLSEEDTGTGDVIHTNSTATEWWVTFYKPERVSVASDLPAGFLAADRSNHNDYDRVPYAFAFRSADATMDFILISVHLKPGDSSTDAQRRRHELMSIAGWIDAHDGVEKDLIILGDMNIEDANELAQATPPGLISLNDECRATNTNVNGPKPYDHVMFNPVYTTEIDRAFDMQVVNLIEAMRGWWNLASPYPGGPPYDHNSFRTYYSDHHPIVIRMRSSGQDDD